MTVTRTPEPETTRIWEEHGERLRQFIRRHVSNPAEVDDVLQETFLKVYKGLPSLKQPERLVSWLYQIARHAIANHYWEPQPAILPDEIAERREDYKLPEDGRSNAFQKTAECLWPMVRRLPAKYRRAVELVEFEGLGRDEAAARLGFSLSGAKSRVQRARGKLKAMLIACCRFECDRRGHVVDFQPNDGATLCASGC